MEDKKILSSEELEKVAGGNADDRTILQKLASYSCSLNAAGTLTHNQWLTDAAENVDNAIRRLKDNDKLGASCAIEIAMNLIDQTSGYSDIYYKLYDVDREITRSL